MKIKTFNEDPNFSIVMRGGCNAECSFCFNKDKKRNDVASSDGEWLFNLYDTLCSLPSQFYQISITGNEPMLSPDISNVMAMCHKLKSKYTNILLTTNGTNLLNHMESVVNGVHHINVSRHHYDEQKNKTIFGGKYSVMDKDLEEIIDCFSAKGVDVSLNCVIDDTTTTDFVFAFIDFAKRVGANAIRFRKKNGKDLNMTPCELAISERYSILSKGECPVCRTYFRIIRGLKTYWKASVIEPTEVINSNVYELVYNTDGTLYVDWNYSKPFTILPNAYIAESDLTQQKVCKMGQERMLYEHMVNDCGKGRSCSRC